MACLVRLFGAPSPRFLRGATPPYPLFFGGRFPKRRRARAANNRAGGAIPPRASAPSSAFLQERIDDVGAGNGQFAAAGSVASRQRRVGVALARRLEDVADALLEAHHAPGIVVIGHALHAVRVARADGAGGDRAFAERSGALLRGRQAYAAGGEGRRRGRRQDNGIASRAESLGFHSSLPHL